ncbi:MAG: LysR family transcriptional regulator [Collinsella aerofaciens]
MQLSQLEYLQAVANYGGVRKAARAVLVSPQAVSSAIKKLELSIRSFCSTGRRARPFCSLQGEFAGRARVILAQVDDLKITLGRWAGCFARRSFRLTPPLSWAGASLTKTGTTRLRVRTPRFTSTCGISQRLRVLSLFCSGYRMRLFHSRSHGQRPLFEIPGEKELKVLSCPVGHRVRAP